MSMNSELRGSILQELVKAVGDIFSVQQSRFDITDGDIEPTLDLNLDERVGELADAMVEVLEYQALKGNEREEKKMAKIVALETIGEYTLIERYNDNGDFLEYVVALNYDDNDKVWASGNYFTPHNPLNKYDKMNSYSLALDYLLYKGGITTTCKVDLKDRFNKQTIPYDRLAELATNFKDGIFDAIDCMEQAYDYFDELDMSEEEKEFFGVNRREYDIYEVECEQVISRKVKVAVPKGSSEEEAEDIAEGIFDGLDYNTDMEMEYGSIETSPRFITRCKADDMDDVENDIDEL